MAEQPRTRDHAHAPPDIALVAIVKAGLVVLAVVAATIAGAFALHAAGVGREGGVFGPAVSGDAVRHFPQPRLQTPSDAERVRYFTAQERRAGEYAWVDRDRGIVRIPVERAMALIAAERAHEAPQRGRP